MTLRSEVALGVAVLGFLLAIGGGLVLATTFVVDVPGWLVTAGWVAWLLALVIFVAYAVREARTDGRSRLSALGAGFREVGSFIRNFMP